VHLVSLKRNIGCKWSKASTSRSTWGTDSWNRKAHCSICQLARAIRGWCSSMLFVFMSHNVQKAPEFSYFSAFFGRGAFELFQILCLQDVIRPWHQPPPHVTQHDFKRTPPSPKPVIRFVDSPSRGGFVYARALKHDVPNRLSAVKLWRRNFKPFPER